MKIDELLEDDPALRLSDFLETSPRDEVYTFQELSERLNLSHGTIDKAPSENRLWYKDQFFFGSTIAVKEFKRRTQND